MPLD
ncbi:predicted protein [Fibroporia radiculosa]|jgi:hypothetical protein